MVFLDKILGLLNKVYRQDKFIKVWLNPVAKQLTKLHNKVIAIYNNFFFDTLDLDGCRHFEKLLKITVDEDTTIENRRAKIQAKWLSNNHNCIDLIQTVCNSWKNGEIKADFVGGKIQLTFIGAYGIPEDLDALLEAVNETKPAHLAYILLYRWLLIKDIHEVMTLNQLQSLTISVFSFNER